MSQAPPVPFSPKPGEMFRLGDKLMMRCALCGDIIRVDKPILGSLHFCS